MDSMILLISSLEAYHAWSRGMSLKAVGRCKPGWLDGMVASASTCGNAPGFPPSHPSLIFNQSHTEAASPKSTESTPVISRTASSPRSTPVISRAASSPGSTPGAASPTLPHDADALCASATCRPCHSTRASVPLRPPAPYLADPPALHALERRPPASPHVTKDPTTFKDILRDHEWFDHKDELENTIVSMNSPLRFPESEVPGLRELQSNAFGDLPRPPEPPSGPALWWSHDL